ncbi:DUF6284 family protein [Streptomyces iconiensis]|uniref:DUF6284 family protein n=1 Tax=Streptomyces iconiensis TaxID=1384038 RepID=A0ABT7AB74_9ACTN|nr:DUF6284 family protein [Streptomyces iconiensis]MDJ1138604.1 DUF6284 family protein [Streptomyces iconiensis]
MRYIDAVQAIVTAAWYDREPTTAQLAAIEREMPAITADIEWLDAVITTLDRTPTELDTRRIRRARRRALDARRDLANHSAPDAEVGA